MGAEIQDGAFVVARGILNSSLWTMRPEDCKLAITCIGIANWKAAKWFDGVRELIIERGQFVRSFEHLASDSHLTIQKTRTSVKHLEKTGFLTRKAYGHYSLFTLPKYDYYQSFRNYSDSANMKPNTQVTSPSLQPNIGPTSAQQLMNKDKKEEEREEGKEAFSSPLGMLLSKAKDAKIAAREDTLRNRLESWIARSDYTRVEQILTDPWTRGKDLIEIQDHFWPKGRLEHTSSKRPPKVNCIGCGGSGKRLNPSTGLEISCSCVEPIPHG